MHPEGIYKEALRAAEAAVKAEVTKLKAAFPSVHYDHHGACGFAWVTVKPARGPFVAWCKSQVSREFGHKAYDGGWQFWSPGYNGQCLSTKELAAVAFCAVLVKHGLKATVGSRLD